MRKYTCTGLFYLHMLLSLIAACVQQTSLGHSNILIYISVKINKSISIVITKYRNIDVKIRFLRIVHYG